MGGIQARFKLDWPGFTLDVDLDLPARGVAALFGHSGSGKTTLLRCIAGLERAPWGCLTVNGDAWQNDEQPGKRGGHWLPTHQRPLGYVFQEASLFAHLSVLGNLRYGLKRTADAQRVSLDQSVELLGIGQLLARKPDQLSGGERQRVGIARALALSPRLLLMDEPLAALDLKRKQEILPYLERLHAELEVPVRYVSHSPDEVARLADHIVVMAEGRAVAAGPLTETLARLALPIQLGEDAGVVLDAVVAERDLQWHLARDVSIALQRTSHSSIQNCQSAVVDEIADDHHPALSLIRLKVGRSPVLARLTRRSAVGLGLLPGLPAWVQIKAVALIG